MHHRPEADGHRMFIDIASGDQPVDLVADMVIDGIFAGPHLVAFMVDDIIAP